MYLVYWCYKTWRDYSKHIQEKGEDSPDDADTTPGVVTVSASGQFSTDESQAAPAQNDLGFFEALSPKHLSSFENMSPHLRGLCALIPYVQDYLLFTILLGVAKRHPDRENVIAKHPILWALFLTLFTISLSLLMFLQGAWYFLFLLSTIPLLWAQAVVNDYWDREEQSQSLIVRTAFTGKELCVTIAGALCVGFLVAGFVLQPNQ